jgi:hypothetical protein
MKHILTLREWDFLFKTNPTIANRHITEDEILSDAVEQTIRDLKHDNTNIGYIEYRIYEIFGNPITNTRG